MTVETGSVIITAFICIFLLPFILCIIDKIFNTEFSCSIYSWHNGKGGNNFFDGCSNHATCSKCGTSVMQDGQGNWF